MGSRNRDAGNGYERKIRKELLNMGFTNIETTRNLSRFMDAKGIDVVGDIPHDIQCKLKLNINSRDIRDLLDRGHEKPLVVFHKHVVKAGNKFMPKGEYVYMTKDLYYELLQQIKVK